MSSEQPELKAGHPPAGKFSLHDYTHTHTSKSTNQGVCRLLKHLRPGSRFLISKKCAWWLDFIGQRSNWSCMFLILWFLQFGGYLDLLISSQKRALFTWFNFDPGHKCFYTAQSCMYNWLPLDKCVKTLASSPSPPTHTHTHTHTRLYAHHLYSEGRREEGCHETQAWRTRLGRIWPEICRLASRTSVSDNL